MTLAKEKEKEKHVAFSASLSIYLCLAHSISFLGFHYFLWQPLGKMLIMMSSWNIYLPEKKL